MDADCEIVEDTPQSYVPNSPQKEVSPTLFPCYTEKRLGKLHTLTRFPPYRSRDYFHRSAGNCASMAVYWR